ncbi:1-phosphofructokinase family hexose kinase [Candidatus Poriferisodalis sp.]|uniref:1-phosphofructokinase family hexose kinase n=1 Tax=Candidatus Poriferisodalis sp. TaxID=3101277 RepID=UPI003B022E67
MITTLTPNPSFDRTLRVDALDRGEVHRASLVRIECAGKGVNIARALAVNEHPARAVFPANDDDFAAFDAALAATGVTSQAVRIRGSIRSNITVVEPDGTTTKINEPGPELNGAEAGELIRAAATGSGSDWLVASGSLAPGTPADFYAQLAMSRPDAAQRLAVDSSGEPLELLVGTPCAVVKPNLSELVSLTRRRICTLGDVVETARDLCERGWGAVLVSLGRFGAVLVGDELAYGTVSVADVRNTVGAGDALLAGFIAAGGRGSAALAEGLAWAGAAVRSVGTAGACVSLEDRQAVAVSQCVPQHLPVGESA